MTKNQADQDYEAVKLFLDAAVSLRILALQEQGGPTTEDFNRIQSYDQLLGERGNFLWMKSKKKGETAKVASAVADAIAVLSFVPDGIEIFGRHWKSNIK
jgi:hypothetical protein